MITTVVLLMVAWALGFCIGWVVKDLMQMRSQVAAQAATTTATTTTTTTTRTVSTQGPVTYAWNRIEPRFLPLSAERHGAWTEQQDER